MIEYDDWLYKNVCPWCDELLDEVDHSLGCPNPKEPLTDRAKKLADFVESILLAT